MGVAKIPKGVTKKHRRYLEAVHNAGGDEFLDRVINLTAAKREFPSQRHFKEYGGDGKYQGSSNLFNDNR